MSTDKTVIPFMSTQAIRSAFLNYFQNKGHTAVTSSSLIPHGDQSILFTNAGMNQFKEVFLGLDPRPYQRAVSSQRCVRAGGKHNDLDNVGYTARHHTFFEMLGNFSFGDYFKAEAIEFAWTFLTEVLHLPSEKLWITVFEEDDEAADIWLNQIKIDPARLSRCGEKDNFWAMGDTGPCGPCSEIFYDHGPEIAGGPPGSPDADGDRYVEIWNLVFMQFNRDASGKMTRLPKPSIDTGMGLERIAAVMQGVHNNYDIDLFQAIIKAIERALGQPHQELASVRVIADHLRSTSFLISDGVAPSNEGRGYVLRRIIRRAVRHGHKLGFKQTFMHRLVPALVAAMGETYPELQQRQTMIELTLKREEEQFVETLQQGMKLFQQSLENLSGNTIPGEVVFRLYDTYGFPIDLTADIAREKGLTIDEVGFQQEMEQQRLRSQASSKFEVDYNVTVELTDASEFIGYEHLVGKSSIEALLSDGLKSEILHEGQIGAIVLKHTPFYAESGGQIGDRGLIQTTDAIFEVQNTQKHHNAVLHYGRVVKGQFKLAEQVEAKVDFHRRSQAASNHSATHLLHSALRQILGTHILQKGSLVEPERLRFDFSHFEGLKFEQLRQIELLVNQQIRANHPVVTQIMTPEQAMDSGAMALFGEKYGAEVRVLSMGDFSIELCGGTHVARTGDIGVFKIISEAGIAAGVRRIEAVTGEHALQVMYRLEDDLKQAAVLLKADFANVPEKIEAVLHQQKSLEKEIERLNASLAQHIGKELLAGADTIGDIQLIIQRFHQMNMKQARELIDQLKSKMARGIILFALEDADKVSLIAGVTSDLIKTHPAGQLVQKVAEQLGGKGGGRPDLAQGGGQNSAQLPFILQSVADWVKQQKN